MTENKLKDLHVGESIKDLIYISDHETYSPLKLSNPIAVLLEIRRRAENYFKDGDEELAFIYFRRYFNKLHEVKHSSKCTQQFVKEIEALCEDKADLDYVFYKIATIRDSLKLRYNRKHDKEKIFDSQVLDLNPDL